MRWRRRSAAWVGILALAAALAAAPACGEDGGGAAADTLAPGDADADAGGDALPDGLPDDLGPEDDADAGPDADSPYGPAASLPAEVPEALRAATWRQHWIDDVRPYWMTAAAFGTPPGNFPTYRGMDGSVQTPSERRPRMIGRQVYVYSAGFLLTGEAALLDHAHAGVRWLLDHARDEARGGWYARLKSDGTPFADDAKLAQDTAYCLLGLAAYFVVTRDPEVEAALLAGRDLLFDPATYWDAANRRIRDGLSADLSAEEDVERDGGWELVAQLDALNGFLVLAQPVLSDPARRAQWLDDMRTLAETLRDTFWQDGIFWGVHTRKGTYGTRHVDFGHTLKSYWMLLQVDKRLPDHPFRELLAEHADAWVERALDRPNGRWAKRPTGPTGVEYGSDWWIYAEADQLAATLTLQDWRWNEELAATSAHWREDYVDRTRPAREVVSSIARDGSWVYPWPDKDTAKCNQWKSGFHSTEHALVLYLVGSAAEGEAATLHFAFAEAAGAAPLARPYLFEGTEAGRREVGDLTVGGATLRHVEVDFVGLW